MRVCVYNVGCVCDDKKHGNTLNIIYTKKTFFESQQVEIQSEIFGKSFLDTIFKRTTEREMGDPWDMIMKGGTSAGDGLKAEIRSLIITPRKWMNESKKT